MVQFPIEQSVFSTYRFFKFPYQDFFVEFFAENHKTEEKPRKKRQKEFLKSVGKHRRSISKSILFRIPAPVLKPFSTFVSAELNFSTSFDRLAAHKVSLDSPWTGLPESEKKLGKMFF